MRGWLVISLVSMMLLGCEFIKMKDQENVDEDNQLKPLARVHETFLYAEDIEGIVPDGLDPQDSANRVERYVNSWIKRQLLIHEASTKISFDEAEIQRKILDYRYSLIGYEYQSYYVNQNLNKDVTEEEISSYYAENQDNFPLKQNIIRGKFVKLPIGAPKLSDLRRWMRSNRAADLEQLQAYCLSYATLFSLEDSTWVNFDEIVRSTPLAQITNKVEYLRRTKNDESSDDDSLYFIRIDEYKKSDDIAPLDVVRDQIVNIIINKRKVELANNLENEVYNKALNSGEFEVFK